MSNSKMSKMKIVAMWLMCVWIICYAINVQSKTTPQPYEVRKLEVYKKTEVERVSPASAYVKPLVRRLHCYDGTNRSLEKLFQSTMIRIFIKGEKFSVYVGGNPEEVFNEFEGSWMNSLAPQRTVTANPFNKTCIFVDTKENYSLQVFITEVDKGRVYLLVAGIMLVFASRTLSRNPAFFYLSSTILGVLTLLILIGYFIHQRIATRTVSTAILIGGWTTVAYFFRQMWIAKVFNYYFVHYVVVSGFISFLVAYRIGPLTNPRSKNVMMWALQGIGVVMIFFSSWLEEVSAAIVVVTLLLFHLVQCLVKRKQGRLGTGDSDKKLDKDVESN